MRLAEMESRHASLQGSSASTARPLLRQIEALNDQLSEKQAAFSALENNLRIKIQEEENKALAAIQSEREAKSEVNDLRVEVSRWKNELDRQRNLSAKLSVQLEQEQESNQKHVTKILELQIKIDTLKNEFQNLNAEYQTLKLKLENIKDEFHKKEKQQEDQINALKIKLIERETEINERREKIPIRLSSTQSSEDLTRNLSSHYSSSLTVVVEKLKTNLDQKLGEIHSLQSQLQSLMTVKSSLEDELVLLTSKNQELQVQVAKISELESSNKQLESRYSACLELLGEKTEKIEELSHDIEDWKVLYKQQVSQLIDTVEKLEKEKKSFQHKIV
eukprot:TRINITY_DN6634_c0_g1_i1.p1 TRINITY_DN6634_c0_g1~~TRINITY_DN6634_c0_g1_i1.p1  ORF type:complete len:333 (+),score=87.82 TRINITY_DN6634_c0_g1_i1:184-1182(+)